jgi:hypothetical protein
MPGFGVGYIQLDGEVHEIGSGTSTQTVAANELITEAHLVMGDVELEVTPLAFGALRLVAPDGRVSLFPRAMARVVTPDGRGGTGWIEWNRNQL